MEPGYCDFCAEWTEERNMLFEGWEPPLFGLDACPGCFEALTQGDQLQPLPAGIVARNAIMDQVGDSQYQLSQVIKYLVNPRESGATDPVAQCNKIAGHINGVMYAMNRARELNEAMRVALGGEEVVGENAQAQAEPPRPSHGD